MFRRGTLGLDSRRRGRVAAAAVLALALAALPTGRALAAGSTALGSATTRLTGNVPHLAAGTTRIGTPAAGERLNIGLFMKGQDGPGLSALLHDLATPGTAAYGHPLTPAQFNARFGVTAAMGNAVRSWVTGSGATVPAGQPLLGRYVLVTGTVGSVSRLLGVHFATYRAADGSMFVANLDAPIVPSSLGILGVVGLDTSVRFTRAATVPNPPIPLATSPSDLWRLYNQPAANTGQGQKLATLLWGSKEELETVVPADLLAFEDANSLPHVPLNFVWQHGYVDPGAASDTTGSGLSETDLDAQASTGMAPKASAITLYYGQNNLAANLIDALGQWVNDPAGSLQLSASFGGCETIDFLLGEEVMEASFAQAVAEGRTVFASSGDNGSGCLNPANLGISPIQDVSFPATSPYVVGVGGTVVTETTHTSPTSEYAWNGSGGGTSLWEAAPPWQAAQSGVVGRCLGDPTTIDQPPVHWLFDSSDPNPLPPLAVNAPPANTLKVCRGVPDVAAQSGDIASGMNDVVNGAASVGAGTSLSAPLWQGMWARVNASAPQGNAIGAGFAAPLLYLNAQGPHYAQDFNDITVGSNGLYSAMAGYDYVTGLGTPNLSNLMTDITGTTAPTDPNAGPPAGGGGGGGGSGTPCGTPQITDASGDATQAVIVDTGQPAVSQDDLDILSGNLSWNGTTQLLTATIAVKNLTATAPNGQSTNEYFRYQFSDTGAWELVASRSSTGEVFTVANAGLNGASTNVSGHFDPATNTITITVPAAALASVGGPALATGQHFTAMSMLAQRNAGVLTLTADSAATPCTYTLP